MTCEETDSLGDYAKSAGQSVLLCGEYLLDSADFLWELLQGVLKFSAASIFDSKMREKNAESLLSMKNYLAIEFYKAYRESEGTKAEKFLAAFAVLGRGFLGTLCFPGLKILSMNKRPLSNVIKGPLKQPSYAASPSA